MSAASDYLEDKVLDHVLTATSYTPPTTRYLALFTNTSGNAAVNLEAGTLTDEVSGGSYAREAITFNAASSGSSTSSATVTFPAASANWGTVTHVAVMDAATSGNVLFWGAVTTPKTIENGDTFQVSSGNLTITLD
jgi:2-keto-4-pentenoate hydratase